MVGSPAKMSQPQLSPFQDSSTQGPSSLGQGLRLRIDLRLRVDFRLKCVAKLEAKTQS